MLIPIAALPRFKYSYLHRARRSDKYRSSANKNEYDVSYGIGVSKRRAAELCRNIPANVSKVLFGPRKRIRQSKQDRQKKNPPTSAFLGVKTSQSSKEVKSAIS
jgi:hypothetical protein